LGAPHGSKKDIFSTAPSPKIVRTSGAAKIRSTQYNIWEPQGSKILFFDVDF
jgi:hypothetical protein